MEVEMKTYKFSEEEIQYIKIALSEQIIKLRKQIDSNINPRHNEREKQNYNRILHTIEVSERYNK